MRFLFSGTLLAIAMILTGCGKHPLPAGLSYAGETRAENTQLLIDETWVDEAGTRHVRQEIFEAVFDIINEADRFIVLDFFLVNDFLYESGPGLRPLSQDLTDRLIAKRHANPDLPIIFISDPINSVYGSVEPTHFKAMADAGIAIVWTDLDKLRDSNPLYSIPWRLFVKRWGTGPGDAVANPLGEGRISMRSMLKLVNFKANHRKLIFSEKSLLVTSANPHSASSAHWNVGLRIDGAGMRLAYDSETAILKMSGSEVDIPLNDKDAGSSPLRDVGAAIGKGNKVELLTEAKIRDKVLDVLAAARPGARIDLSMFYLAQKEIVDAMLKARKRGCTVRVILDPNKDAFGRIKNGFPNRQTAFRLVKAGVPLRWADTHGEQFHTKMLYAEQTGDSAVLLLGSCNFTRRNTDNFNAECSVALTAPSDDETMAKARDAFDRWWTNAAGRGYTTDYATYADPSLRRRLRVYVMESTGMSSF